MTGEQNNNWMTNPQERYDSVYGDEGMAQLVKELLSDEITSEKLKTSTLWFMTTNSFKLTFLDDLTAQLLRLKFREAKVAYRASIPDWLWDSQKRLTLTNIEFVFEANLNRAKGFNEGRLNERVLMSSQIKHATTVLAESAPVRPAGIKGFVGRMFGR